MNTKIKALIYGAGAIGRGYLAPLLHKHGISISFVDINKRLVDHLKKNKRYKTAITGKDSYEIVDVDVKNSYNFGENINVNKFDIVFSCVGPNKCYDLAEDLKSAKAVISCENDMSTVENLIRLTNNSNIYFGIPDVIASNTAPKDLLKKDPLMAVTERGVLVVQKGNYDLPTQILQVDEKELNMHWMCKLFIHNAPHAIVAYLGWLRGYNYIHEAMSDKEINDIVTGSIFEITEGVIAANFSEEKFANEYKSKELKRFSNNLLYDTINRVAREPIRKIAPDNRLVLGLRIAMYNCILPKNTAKGLKAALMYNDKKDTEATFLQNLISNENIYNVLKKYTGIDHFDPIGKFIIKQNLSSFSKREFIEK